MIIVFWPFQCLRLLCSLCRSATFWSHSFVTGSYRPTYSGAWSYGAVGPLCFKILLFLVNKVSGQRGEQSTTPAGCLSDDYTWNLTVWMLLPPNWAVSFIAAAKLTLQHVAVSALNDLQPGQKGLGEVCSPHTRHRQCWVWTAFLGALSCHFTEICKCWGSTAVAPCSGA